MQSGITKKPTDNLNTQTFQKKDGKETTGIEFRRDKLKSNPITNYIKCYKLNCLIRILKFSQLIFKLQDPTIFGL